jgi:hypothetical protein
VDILTEVNVSDGKGIPVAGSRVLLGNGVCDELLDVNMVVVVGGTLVFVGVGEFVLDGLGVGWTVQEAVGIEVGMVAVCVGGKFIGVGLEQTDSKV